MINSKKVKTLRSVNPTAVDLVTADFLLALDLPLARNEKKPIMVRCSGCDVVRSLTLRAAARSNFCRSCGCLDAWAKKAAGTYKKAESKTLAEFRALTLVSNALPELASRFTENSPVRPDEVTTNSHAICEIACGNCGAVHRDRVIRAVRNKFCRACMYLPRGDSIADLFPLTARNVTSVSPSRPELIRQTSMNELEVECDGCRSVRRAPAKNFKFDSDPWQCRGCATGSHRPRLEEFAAEKESWLAPEDRWLMKLTVAKLSKHRVNVECPECGRRQDMRADNLRKWNYCRFCASAKSDRAAINEAVRKAHLTGKSIAEVYPALADQITSDSPLAADEIALFSRLRIAVACSECHKVVEGAARSFVRRGVWAVLDPWPCDDCFVHQSAPEIALAEWVDSVVASEILRNTRKVIRPLELDVWIPLLRIAVELNGDYWHSNEFTSTRPGKSSSAKHHDKLTLCTQRGITLAYVWENDWYKRTEEVKSALLHLFETGELSPILTRTVPHDEPMEVGLFAK